MKIGKPVCVLDVFLIFFFLIFCLIWTRNILSGVKSYFHLPWLLGATKSCILDAIKFISFVNKGEGNCNFTTWRVWTFKYICSFKLLSRSTVDICFHRLTSAKKRCFAVMTLKIYMKHRFCIKLELINFLCQHSNQNIVLTPFFFFWEIFICVGNMFLPFFFLLLFFRTLNFFFSGESSGSDKICTVSIEQTCS